MNTQLTGDYNLVPNEHQTTPQPIYPVKGSAPNPKPTASIGKSSSRGYSRPEVPWPNFKQDKKRKSGKKCWKRKFQPPKTSMTAKF